MSPHERSLLNYLYLAKVSSQKQQRPGRDRFLVLSLVKAVHTGWLEIAEECRRIITDDSPRHLLNRHATAAEAMRTEDFAFFAKQLERGCPPERAEQLAQGLGFDADAALAACPQELSRLLNELLQGFGGSAG
ncbi:MAG: hypothetical protein R3C12_17040 [Planctomycetaceae bacterium]|nr:hypothetical protein [Planctomycetaceae bacterium]